MRDEGKLAIDRWENEGGWSLWREAPRAAKDSEEEEAARKLNRSARLTAMPGEPHDAPGIHSSTPKVCDLTQNRLLGHGNLTTPRRGRIMRNRDNRARQLPQTRSYVKGVGRHAARLSAGGHYDVG